MLTGFDNVISSIGQNNQIGSLQGNNEKKNHKKIKSHID